MALIRMYHPLRERTTLAIRRASLRASPASYDPSTQTAIVVILFAGTRYRNSVVLEKPVFRGISIKRPKLFILAWVFLSVFLGICVVEAHSQQVPKTSLKQTMTPAELSDFLNRLRADLGTWKRTLSPEAINSLSVQYQEGKIIEERYNFVARWIDQAQQDAEALSKKGGLGASVALLIDLDELFCSMDSLSSQLSNPMTAQGGSARKMIESADGIVNIEEALNPYVVRFRNHTLALAKSADQH